MRLPALNGIVFCAAIICLASPSIAKERPFSFPDAEHYMADDEAMASAQAFVTSQLPPGLAKAEAVARLTRAGLDCGRPKSPDALTCAFGTMADTWTVSLRLDSRGTVSQASVDHRIIGWASN
jgi:hypothetical protein